MQGTDVKLLKNCLWGLSNFLEDDFFIVSFFKEESLPLRVLFFMQNNTNSELQQEACYAMTNTLLNSSSETIAMIRDTLGDSDLTYSLGVCLKVVQKKRL
jgi:hypothetical protein